MLLNIWIIYILTLLNLINVKKKLLWTKDKISFLKINTKKADFMNNEDTIKWVFNWKIIIDHEYYMKIKKIIIYCFN